MWAKTWACGQKRGQFYGQKFLGLSSLNVEGFKYCR